MARVSIAYIIGIVTLLVVGLGGCGPDEPNDERNLLFTGRAAWTNGVPINGATITLFETGEVATTDENGEFSLQSFRHPSSVGLFLELDDFTNTITIESIPSDSEVVTVLLSVDLATNEASLKDISFDSEEPSAPVEPTPSGPVGTPIPGGTPTATPTPKPGNFDNNGNTTRFGIPSGLTGNISRGRSVWSRTCSSCHATEKANKSYTDIKRALQSISQMQSLRVPNQSVADVTAYLNRGRR